jgi:hypothetical protein
MPFLASAFSKCTFSRGLAKTPIYIRHHLGGNADAVFNHIGMPQHSIDAAKIFWGRADKPNQAAVRGWLINDVEDVVRNPALTRTHVNHATGNPATYFYRTDGHYAVIDDVTGEIIQVSEIGNSNWVDMITNQPIQPITLP